MSHLEDYLTVQQVSDILNMPRTTIYDKLRKNKIPGAIKINRTWLIPTKSVRYIKEETPGRPPGS